MSLQSHLAFSTLALAALGASAQIVVPIDAVDAFGIGARVGEVVFTESPHGVVVTPALRGLPPGAHGFHVHEHGRCATAEVNGKAVAAGAAGGHFDPAGSKRHGPPWGEGHAGDLPVLFAAADGTATTPGLAPRLKLSDLHGRALVIHAGGDNHADQPAPLGGGGARIACGVIG